MVWINTDVSAQVPSAAEQQTGKANFREIRKRFNDEWKGRVVTRGSGYKVFRRWEWYWDQRVGPDGSFPPNDVVVKEWERFSAGKSLGNNAGNWTSMGPAKPENRYFGLGRLNCIAFHPKEANTFWVGTPSSGLWKTTDFGVSWTKVFDETNPLVGVSDIVIDPKKPDTLYVATGDGDAGNSVGTFNNTGAGDTKSIGIMKSTDGGKSWTTKQLPYASSQSTLISRLIMHPDSSNILFAVTSIGIYRTTDGGNNWNYINLFANFCDIAFHPNHPDTIYAATRSTFVSNGPPVKYRSSQVWRSADRGITWDSITKFSNIRRIKLAVSKQEPALLEIVCVSQKENGLAGIYRSKDAGSHFTDTVVKVLNNCSNNYLNSYHDPEMHEKSCEGQGDYDLCYLINPSTANERWLGGVNTYKSTDRGKEFNLVNYWNDSVPKIVEQVHADKHWFAFHPLRPGTFFECNDGGVYYTSNGGKTWKDISAGLPVGQVYRLGSSYVDPDLVIAGFQDNGSQVDSTGKWKTPNSIGGDGTECLIDWLDPLIQYASYPGGEIKRTNDGTWSKENTQVISDSIPEGHSGAWITPFLIDPDKREILYAGYKFVYKTENSGRTWKKANPNFPAPIKDVADDTLIRTLCISESRPETMYAARKHQIFKTTDGWKSYLTVNTVGLPIDTTMLTGIAIHPSRPDTVFITFSGYHALKVFRSNDGGKSWKDISGTGLPRLPVNCIVYEEGPEDALYIGTDAGVFYRNNTTSWIPFSNNLPNAIVSDLEIEYGTGKIRAATFGRGLWETDLYVAPGDNKVNVVDIPKNGGDVSGGGTFKSGQKARLTAKSEPGFSFEGWFENGLKVYDSTSYEIEVNSSHNFVGRFNNPASVEENLKSKVRLYPNPSKGLVNLVMDPGLREQLVKVIAISLDSRLACESVLQKNGEQVSIDLSAYAQGNYILTLYFKSGEKISYKVMLKTQH